MESVFLKRNSEKVACLECVVSGGKIGVFSSVTLVAAFCSPSSIINEFIISYLPVSINFRENF